MTNTTYLNLAAQYAASIPAAFGQGYQDYVAPSAHYAGEKISNATSAVFSRATVDALTTASIAIVGYTAGASAGLTAVSVAEKLVAKDNKTAAKAAALTVATGAAAYYLLDTTTLIASVATGALVRSAHLYTQYKGALNRTVTVVPTNANEEAAKTASKTASTTGAAATTETSVPAAS